MNEGILIYSSWGRGVRRKKRLAYRFLSRGADLDASHFASGLVQSMECLEDFVPVGFSEVLFNDIEKRACRFVPVCCGEVIRKGGKITGSVHLIRSLNL